MKYLGYTIEVSDDSPLGRCFTVMRPGTNTTWLGCWSLADAKRGIRQDIKQQKCAHDGATGRGKDGKYEYCALCDKLLRRVPKAATGEVPA